MGYLDSAYEELNKGRLRTNPVSRRVEDLNPEPPDYKSSALTIRPRRFYRHLLFSLSEGRRISNGKEEKNLWHIV